LHVLGINGDYFLKLVDGIIVLTLQKVNSAEVVSGDAIRGILFENKVQLIHCCIVFSLIAQKTGIKIMSAGEMRSYLERPIENLLCARQIAFLQADTRHIHPPV